jgi:phosphatidate cytidylyltransferase
MLKQRVITALVLLAALLPTLWVQASWPFLVFIAVAMAAAGWEWAKLNGVQGVGAIAFGGFVLALLGSAMVLWGKPPAWLWQLSLLAWVLGGALVLRGASPGWLRVPQPLRLLLGAAALVVAGLAFEAWKGQGINALLSVLCLVWAADIAAYFGGRRFGKRKLAPAISPGKSWEGVWSGWLGVLLLAVVWVYVVDPRFGANSLFSQLVGARGWPLALLACLMLAMLSVVGDLFESLVKRAVGAKDSSQLLPGHGGVLDRIDALLPTLPLALALTQGMPA